MPLTVVWARRCPPVPRPHPSRVSPLPLPPQVNIIRELRHPYIIRYLDRIVEKHTTKLFIVMEYCENGDLGALIKKHQREGYAALCLRDSVGAGARVTPALFARGKVFCIAVSLKRLCWRLLWSLGPVVCSGEIGGRGD